MFMRRGETRNVVTLPDHRPDPNVIAAHLAEARAAAASQAQTAAMMMVQQPLPPPVAVPPPVAEPAQPPASRSVIGESLTIEGQSITIRCDGALEINGTIEAELHSRELIVGASGKVTGTIAADAVEIFGRVNGTILGARVTLHPKADVEGDIHAKALSVAEGATFDGRSRKVTDPASIAPRLSATAPTEAGSFSVPLPRTI